MLFLLLGASNGLALDILINEVYYDAPTGADEAASEWVELCNPTSSTVDLSGWTLESAGSAWTESWTFPSGTTIAPGDYLAFGPGAGDASEFSPNLQNGGSETDGVRLVNSSSTVIDTVLYDTTNTNGLLDDLGSIKGPFAPDVSAGNALARFPDCTETTNDGDDFVEVTTLTQGAANPGLSDCSLADDAWVLINEFMANPAGSDTDTEWVELYNPGTVDADLSGWLLMGGTTPTAFSELLPDGTILPAGGYLILGGSLAVTSLGTPPDVELDISLGNATSNADGILIADCNGLIYDTVVYGPSLNPDDGWTDDGGGEPTLAPKPADGVSIGRVPNGVDTDDIAADFSTLSSPSPWEANPGPTDCSLADDAWVLINEFMANPAGSDTDTEWVELYNPGTVDADLSGWLLMGGTTPTAFSELLPSGTILPAGGYLILGGALAVKSLGAAPDVEVDFSLGNATSSADGVLIADCNGLIYDTVVYGPSLNKTDGWTDDGGGEPTLAPKPGDGVSIGRLPNGVDTDDIAADFSGLPFPSPWEENDRVGTCPGQDAVKINEFLPNPDSDTTSADDTREWVELYNTSGEAIDLSGWELQWGTSSYSGSFSLPPGTSIPGGGFLVIGGESVAEADVVISKDEDLAMGAASSTPDAVRLLHCGPGLADTVLYGPVGAENSDEWTDDSGALATSWGPKAAEGLSIARRSDGVDTDDSGDDFVISATPSPGSANPVVACTSGGGSGVTINEIFPNPASTDSGNEWLEIYNGGSGAISLDGWSIQSGSSSWATKFTFPPETTIAPGEFLLVAEDLVPSEVVDFYTDTNLSLGNASNGLDGVRLVDCPGDVTDTLLYGKSGADTDADEEAWAEDDAGGTSYAFFPDDDATSIGRYPDGVDTDDNSVDFASNVTPTPGSANNPGATGGGGGSGGGGTGKGCSKDTDASGGSGKCSAIAPLASSPLWLLPLVSFFRRRDRRSPPPRGAAGR